MSSGADARGRPGIWSYLSFKAAARRRISVSLPTLSAPSQVAEDPYEKPDRHSGDEPPIPSSFWNDIQIAWMNQGQRSRYLKVGLVLVLIIFALLWLSPNRGYVEG